MMRFQVSCFRPAHTVFLFSSQGRNVILSKMTRSCELEEGKSALKLYSHREDRGKKKKEIVD